MSAVETTPEIPEQVRDQAEALALAVTSTSLAIDATTYKIATPEGYEFATAKLAEVKGKAKRLEELRVSIVKPLNESVARINAFFRVPAEAYAKAENGYKGAILTYQQEEAARVRREQAKLEEQARKEREALQAKAEKALAAGKEEKAAELAVRAATVVAPVAQPAIQKAAGVSVRRVWKARVVKPELVPREYTLIDLAKLDKIAKALKQDAIVAGVEFYYEDNLSSVSR